MHIHMWSLRMPWTRAVAVLASLFLTITLASCGGESNGAEPNSGDGASVESSTPSASTRPPISGSSSPTPTATGCPRGPAAPDLEPAADQRAGVKDLRVSL